MSVQPLYNLLAISDSPVTLCPRSEVHFAWPKAPGRVSYRIFVKRGGNHLMPPTYQETVPQCFDSLTFGKILGIFAYLFAATVVSWILVLI